VLIVNILRVLAGIIVDGALGYVLNVQMENLNASRQMVHHPQKSTNRIVKASLVALIQLYRMLQAPFLDRKLNCKGFML